MGAWGPGEGAREGPRFAAALGRVSLASLGGGGSLPGGPVCAHTFLPSARRDALVCGGRLGSPFPLCLMDVLWIVPSLAGASHRRGTVGPGAQEAEDASRGLERPVPLLPQGARGHWDLVAASELWHREGGGGGAPRDS